ncbi:hypothetical protein NP233_g9359 [Leucocoprinus birnbaumii]|uniref:Uncharacterized protein n=1 Tax=Leucocoprinus birnbaumii TaxID=56174 RepID=A0AAD5YQX6_9AGAR|nr:hypothetical protein NP233_g9359 [Leucocoprinus birnbaumii]
MPDPVPASTAPKKTTEKFQDDVWCSNPPQVTSYITYPRLQTPKLNSRTTYTSPICGFGWRFELNESFQCQTPSSNPQIQEFIGQTALAFQPHMCSSMPLSPINATVRVSYPNAEGPKPVMSERIFYKVAVQTSSPTSPGDRSERDFGKYLGPPQYKGEVQIQVTIAFDPSDGLSLPNTSSTNTKEALRRSLDTPAFVDTKFYLFAGKIDGRPAKPREIFVRSDVLNSSSSFLKDLLSQDTGFSTGTPCDLLEDVQEELAKLNADTFDYDSDSDLEDDDELVSKGKQRETPGSAPHGEDPPTTSSSAENVRRSAQSITKGKAFAVNGTAYQTWKTFIYYTYTNEITFNKLRSQRTAMSPEPRRSKPEDLESDIRCSPKSMYRFADYVDIPTLKSMSKEELRKRLSKSNIIQELFSSFTNRYQEIIEMEVDFLVANFTLEVARHLDEMLQMIVLGTKPHSFRVLGFAMRRLRGDSKEVAWSALDPVSNSMPPLNAGMSSLAPRTPVMSSFSTGRSLRMPSPNSGSLVLPSATILNWGRPISPQKPHTRPPSDPPPKTSDRNSWIPSPASVNLVHEDPESIPLTPDPIMAMSSSQASPALGSWDVKREESSEPCEEPKDGWGEELPAASSNIMKLGGTRDGERLELGNWFASAKAGKKNGKRKGGN